MIYFDNAATRRVSECVLDAFNKVSREDFGNSSSNHKVGADASKYLEQGRTLILDTLKLNKTHKLVFTSGATESNNLAIKGIAHRYKNRGMKIISAVNEHASVIEPLKELKDEGFTVILLPIDENGSVSVSDLEKEIDNQTILVSLMTVNNEVGSYNDIKKISSIVHKYPKCFLHMDATQSMCKDEIDYSLIDLISFSAHKFGALKGVGGLLYKSNIMFEPVNAGGGQEAGVRSGTVNVAGDYSAAIGLYNEYKNITENLKKVSDIKNFLIDELLKTGEVSINSPINSTPYILNISLKNKKASVVVEALSQKDVYVSSVSACSSKHEPISEILLAMGKTNEVAANSLRISFSNENSMEDAELFIEKFKEVISEVVNR